MSVVYAQCTHSARMDLRILCVKIKLILCGLQGVISMPSYTSMRKWEDLMRILVSRISRNAYYRRDFQTFDLKKIISLGVMIKLGTPQYGKDLIAFWGMGEPSLLLSL